MTWKEHFPGLVSATILLRTASIDDLSSFFDEYVGATGASGWWVVQEEGITKIDIAGVDSGVGLVDGRLGQLIISKNQLVDNPLDGGGVLRRKRIAAMAVE